MNRHAQAKRHVPWLRRGSRSRKGIRRLAARVLTHAGKNVVIAAADTTVELDGEIFGKPLDSAHAREMLGKLSGRTHSVLTGIFLLKLPSNETRAAVENSAVTFSALGEQEIDAYAESGEPLGKAGAYAFKGASPDDSSPKIEGCYFSANIVGLHSSEVIQTLGGTRLGRRLARGKQKGGRVDRPFGPIQNF